MDSFLGHRDSVNPENMELESSTIFRPISPASASSTSVSSPTPSPTCSPAAESDEQEKPIDKNAKSPPTDVASTSAWFSVGQNERKFSVFKVRNAGENVNERAATRQRDFQQMWEKPGGGKSLQQEKERFNKCMDMMQ